MIEVTISWTVTTSSCIIDEFCKLFYCALMLVTGCVEKISFNLLAMGKHINDVSDSVF